MKDSLIQNKTFQNNGLHIYINDQRYWLQLKNEAQTRINVHATSQYNIT